MKRSLTDIRENLDYVGCDNETARELCDEVERLSRQRIFCEHCGGQWLDDGINSGCACREIQRLRADIDVEKIKELWNGIGIMRAALTEEQREKVARICYHTPGVCFCGCHGDECAAEYTAGDAGEE